ncbi:MAG TPA: response regulator [Bdellovibrionales bacterium]|nr:response regulator [Bdellovibrionales bacterium]
MTKAAFFEAVKRVIEERPYLVVAFCVLIGVGLEYAFLKSVGFAWLLVYPVTVCLAAWLTGFRGGVIVTAVFSFFTIYIFRADPTLEGVEHRTIAVAFTFLTGLFCSFLFRHIHSSFQSLKDQIEEDEAALERSQQSNQLKRDFIANMSHEVRVPLSAVLGYAEVLANENLTKEERESYIERLKLNAASLTHLVTDILDVTEIEADHFIANRKKMLFRNFVHDVYGTFAPLAHEKGLKLQIQLRGALPTYIESDAEQLKQVLKHVIGNSIRFSSGGLVKITVSSSKTPDRRREVAFIVSDQGPGIPIEIKRKLFKFVDQPGTEPNSAPKAITSGMGLIVARKLARALGGDVKLAKSNQRGTTMVVTVDGGMVDDAQDFFDQLSVSTAEPTISPSDPHALEGVRVLIVDDSADAALLVGRMLKGVGVNVDIANTAIDGIEKAVSNSPDVVLMDIQMPEVDGNEATRRLRRRGFVRPIVALSAHVMRADQEEAIRAGVNEFLMKPVSRRALIEQINRYVHRRPAPLSSGFAPQPVL